jgi:hypothetical protein
MRLNLTRLSSIITIIIFITIIVLIIIFLIVASIINICMRAQPVSLRTKTINIMLFFVAASQSHQVRVVTSSRPKPCKSSKTVSAKGSCPPKPHYDKVSLQAAVRCRIAVAPVVDALGSPDHVLV